MLDETDLALIDALQIAPRASWSRLGEVLELAPITLARRWERLSGDGSAWLSVSNSNATARGAILEIACRPGAEAGVAEELASRPYVSTVGIATGEYQVYALVVASTVDDTARLLLGARFPDGVRKVRSHVFGGLYGGMTWRLRVINQKQETRLRRPSPPPVGDARPFGPQDRQLFIALARDGRRPYTELAAELHSTPKAVQRRINRLERSGEIVFRCDVARRLAGRGASALIWLSVPDADLPAAGAVIAAWAESRMCAPVASAANLVLFVDLRSFEHLEEVLVRIARTLPSATVIDRRLVLRQVKVYGRLVDESGRSIGVVPPDPWYASEVFRA